MARKRRTQSVNIPIHTLSGGVAKQAPSKRLPSEAEEIDNCLVSLERSIEKRPPISHISTNTGDGRLDVKYLNGEATPNSGTKATATLTIDAASDDVETITELHDKTLILQDVEGAAFTLTFDNTVKEIATKATETMKFKTTTLSKYCGSFGNPSDAFYDTGWIGLTDAAGVYKKYKFIAVNPSTFTQYATGALAAAPTGQSQGFVWVNIYGKTTVQQIADEFKEAVDGANGHNAGTAGSVISITTSSDGSALMQQQTLGTSGNTNIIEKINGNHNPDKSSGYITFSSWTCDYRYGTDVPKFTGGYNGGTSSTIGLHGLTTVAHIYSSIITSIDLAIVAGLRMTRTGTGPITLTMSTAGLTGNNRTITGTSITPTTPATASLQFGDAGYVGDCCDPENSVYANKTITLTDSSGASVVFTIKTDGTATGKVTSSAYNVSFQGVSKKYQYAERFQVAVALAKTNSDLAITAVWAGDTATAVSLTQDVVGNNGNRAVTSNVSGTKATATITVLNDQEATLATNLDGTTFILNDGSSSVTFTFDDDTNGALGTTISVWDVDDTPAIKADAADFNGFTTGTDRIRLNVPTAAGGAGSDIDIQLVNDTDGSTSAGSGVIGVGTSGASASTVVEAVIDAINGITNSRVHFGSGTSASGIVGLIASIGTSGTKMSLEANNPGTAGNAITIANAAGDAASAGSLAGGLDGQMTAKCVANRIVDCINSNSINITATPNPPTADGGGDYAITLTQDTASDAGNTAITATSISNYITYAAAFTGGTRGVSATKVDAVDYNGFTIGDSWTFTTPGGTIYTVRTSGADATGSGSTTSTVIAVGCSSGPSAGTVAETVVDAINGHFGSGGAYNHAFASANSGVNTGLPNVTATLSGSTKVTLTHDEGANGNTAVVGNSTGDAASAGALSGGHTQILGVTGFTGGVGNMLTPTTFASGTDDVIPDFNSDNLYYHFLDIDGTHRYCIVVNRSIQNTSGTDLVNIYRIEPTEWVKETFDLGSYDDCMKDYILYKNLASDLLDADGSSMRIDEVLGSIDYGKGIVLFNKHIELEYLPDNSNLTYTHTDPLFKGVELDPQYNQAGTPFRFKVGSMGWGCSTTQLPGADTEDLNPICYGDAGTSECPACEGDQYSEGCFDLDGLCKWYDKTGGFVNVSDHIEARVNTASLEPYDVGKSRTNFGDFDVPPAADDYKTFMGTKARRVCDHTYNPFTTTVKWSEAVGAKNCRPNPFYGPGQLDDRFLYTGEDGMYGEVWYARESFFTFPSGFYRVTSKDGLQPYFHRMRSEGPKSVLDHTTFPLMIYKSNDLDDNGNGKWKIRYMPLQPKLSGGENTNPGPTAIDNKEKIKGACIWGDRLWFGTESTIFSSRMGEYFDFFLNDYLNIVDTDPIDLSLNIGKYSVISHMVPFQGYIFLTTESGTQFEVRPSGTLGTITPTTTMIRPSSFFSTSAKMTPIRMGTKIYFFDKKKLFLYSGAETFGYEFSTAYELSEHCRDYLPKNFKDVTASSATNSIFMVDKDIPYHLYVYTNRITDRGEMQQNAFHRWILHTSDSIEAVHSYENDLYIIVRRTNGQAQGIYAYHMSLDSVPTNTPLMDRMVKLSGDNITYDGNTNLTTFHLPYYDTHANEIVLAEDWDYSSGGVTKKQAFTRLTPVQLSAVDRGDYWTTDVIVNGNWKQQNTSAGTVSNFVDRSAYVGRPYDMNVELSTIFQRDRDNNAVDGTLNLKRITTRHKDTGQYDIEITRRGRSSTTVRSEALTLDDSTDLLGDTRIDSEGELISKILAPADGTTIKIKSSYPTPCNISNIDLIANFRPYMSSPTQQ